MFAPSPDAQRALALVETERVTATALVPAIAIRWMESPGLADRDLSSLKLLQVGGQRFQAEHARLVRVRLGCTLQQVYGMAEGLLNYTRPDDPEDVIVGTQGRPMLAQDEVRVVDENDRDVAEGVPGELLTRGPYTLRGYYRAPEHNGRCFTSDGWYRSGDLVRWHNGNLIVEGRIKDLINRGGEKISSEELNELSEQTPRRQFSPFLTHPRRSRLRPPRRRRRRLLRLPSRDSASRVIFVSVWTPVSAAHPSSLRAFRTSVPDTVSVSMQIATLLPTWPFTLSSQPGLRTTASRSIRILQEA